MTLLRFYFSSLFIIALVAIHVRGDDISKEKKRTKLKDIRIIPVHKPDECQLVAEKGDTVAVEYTGTLEDGQVFDSSEGEGREPIAFKLGSKKVIPGWEKGVMGMCLGEKRKLIIPPHLAYGDQGFPPHIPEKATLQFDVHMVDVQKPSAVKSVLSFLKFAAMPATVAIAIYFAYQKYKSKMAAVETPSKKKLKEERRMKKRK